MKTLQKLRQIKSHVDNCLEIDISAKLKKDKYVNARMAYYILASTHTKATLREVGNIVNRDHATVLYNNGRHYLLKDNYKWVVNQFDSVSISDPYLQETDYSLMELQRAHIASLNEEIIRLKRIISEVRTVISTIKHE